MWLLTFLLCLSYIDLSALEFFSSTTDLKALLTNEAIFIETVEFMIKDQMKYFEKLEGQLDTIKKEHLQLTSENTPNPITQYKIIRRLSTNWNQIETEIEARLNQFKDNRQLLEENNVMPSSRDLTGASQGIFRLQDTYGLITSDLASGIVDGISTGHELSFEDCYELGSQAYNLKDYYKAAAWLIEAYEKINGTKSDKVQMEILDKLHVSLYKTKNISEALKYVNQLLEIYPTSGKGVAYREKYETILKLTPSSPSFVLLDDPFILTEREKQRYISACRGELTKSPEEEKLLYCRYVNNNNPFLKLGPIKQEDVNLDPLIVLYHDVVSSLEADQIISAAHDKLFVSSVGVGEVSRVRVSKDTSLKPQQYPLLKNIDYRFEALTGLKAKSAENHSIVNYGVGGHYEPHVDFSHQKYRGSRLFHLDHYGNRLATAVIYLSDVTRGGATVFPYLNVKVEPKKGSAVFWYNLYKDGEGNYMTRHAACPVLLGSKWCDNLWFRERGQRFGQACKLKPDHQLDFNWISFLDK